MAENAAPESLASLQRRFAAHIRDPGSVAPPDGVDDRRMGVYRDLFLNNIKGLLAGNFPVLRTLFDDDGWSGLCRDFYREHRCRTPLFPELPREFLRYLEEGGRARRRGRPFLLELAHYEWVELALSLDGTEPGDLDFDADGDLLRGRPLLSPLAWPLSYRFPVHRIRADYQPQKAPAQATQLLVWRRRDYGIRFMQLNEATRLLLLKMQEKPARSGRELLTATARAIGHPEPAAVIDYGATLLSELRSKQVILGTLR